MIKMTKYWWESKTVWFGILTALVSFLSTLGEQQFITQNPVLVSVIGIAVGLITVGLRFITNSGIKNDK